MKKENEYYDASKWNNNHTLTREAMDEASALIRKYKDNWDDPFFEKELRKYADKDNHLSVMVRWEFDSYLY